MANVRNIVTNLNGNVIINSESDNGSRLQVTGNGTISGDWNASGYVTANGEGLGASLRVGGIYGALGLYIPSGYNMQFDLGHDGVFRWTRGNAEKMRLTYDGKVGIGTTAPGAKLDIVSTGAGSEGLRVDGESGGFAFVVKGGSDYTSHIRAGATIGVNYFTTPPSNGLIVEGNVGIGTTSLSDYSLLHVNLPNNKSARFGSWEINTYTVNNAWLGENVYFDGSNFKYRNNGYANLLYSDAASGFQIRMTTGTGTAGDTISTATNLSIKPNGNVQIGSTTDAGYKLDVSGTARITGTVSSETSFYVVATPPANNGGLINVRDTITATNVTSFAGIFFNSSPGSDYSIGKLTENGTGFLQVRNANNGSELLRINASGISTFSSSVTASSLIKSGGTSSEYLMADGSVSTTATINNYTQTFYVPNTGGTSQWVKLGTWTAAQGGNVITVQIDQHAGYNAATNQNQQVYIYMKTSNGSSVDANGFAGDSSFWTEGLNQNIEAGDVIWEANAAGVAATSYTLYVNMGQYTNASQYTVTTRGGTWTNVGTLTSPSGTTSSSTILLSENRFVVNNVLTVGGAPSGNVLIGTYTDGGYKLDVNGNTRSNGIIIGTDQTYGGTYRSVSFGANQNGYNRIFATTDAADGMYFASATGTGFTFRPNGGTADLVKITSTGNVLIGTTTDNGRKLQVQGDASVSGEIYSNQISQSRYIRYVFGGTNFSVGGPSLATRWVIGRVYYNEVHWGAYSGMDIEIVNNQYNGGRKKYSITNGAGGPILTLRFSQSYGSRFSRIVLGSAVDTGTTYAGAINYYKDVYLEVSEYNQVSIIGELKGSQISIDKTSIGSGEYGWATLFSSPSSSGISTFNSYEPTALSYDGNWGYVDSSLGINTTSPSYNLDITAGLSDGTSNYIAIFESNKGASGNAYVGIGAYRSDALAAGRNAYINVVAPSGGAASLGLQIDGGNVGIGTPTPDAKLTIGADDSATNVGYIRLRGHDVYEANIYKTATYGIYMDTDTNARPIRIDGSAFITGITGNVLIGTTTDAGYKLDVNGNTRIQGNSYVTSRNYISLDGNLPVAYKIPYTQLAGGTVVSDNLANGGSAKAIYSSSTPGTFFFGPYSSIEPGSYVAKFRLKVASNASSSSIGTIDVAGTNIAGNSLLLRPSMFPTSGDYYYFSVPFTVGPAASGSLETRWLNWPGGITDAYVDHVFIESAQSEADVYVPTSKDFNVYTDGTSKLVVKNNGNVGIGTTSPTQGLHVSSAVGSANTGITIQNTSTGNPQLRFLNSSGTEVLAMTYISGTTSSLYIYTAAAGNLLNLVGANVGIGTTSPKQKLDVAGAGGKIAITNTGTTDYSELMFYEGASTKAIIWVNGSAQTDYAGANSMNIWQGSNAPIVFYTNGTNERMRITGAGNVGIGTSAPDTPLSSARGIVINSGASNDVQIRMQNNATGSAGSDGGLLSISGSQMYLWNYEASNLIFGTNNSERMRIDSSGNVGIGTTSISYRVDISGDARILSGSLGVGVAPNATDGRIDASNDIVAYSTSDQRLKENVTPIENALEKVKTLTGVEFDWKEETAHVHGYHGHDVGIIAQDVQAVLPEAVRTNDSGYLSVRYEKMIGLLIEGMKEQQNQIDELKAKLNGLTR